MGRRTNSKRKRRPSRTRTNLRAEIAGHVAALYPGCVAEFVGQQSRARLVSRTFGFRVQDPRGKYRSNIVWVNPEYAGTLGREWVRAAIAASND